MSGKAHNVRYEICDSKRLIINGKQLTAGSGAGSLTAYVMQSEIDDGCRSVV